MTALTESALWKKLAHARDEQALEALQKLVQNRAKLSLLNVDKAQLLLQILEGASDAPELSDQLQAACLYLLVSWCRTNSGGRTQFLSYLTQATSLAIKIAGHSGKSPELSSAACLFLSCSAGELSAAREDCQNCICQVMLEENAALRQSGHLTELIGSLGRLNCMVEDAQKLLWNTALMLRIWEFEGQSGYPAAVTALSQMAALQPAYAALAGTTLQKNSGLSTAQLLEEVADLLETASSHVSRQRSAAAFALAGLLEGCWQPLLSMQHTLPSRLLELLTSVCQLAGQGGATGGPEEWLLLQAAASSVARVHLACSLPHPPSDTTRCAMLALSQGAFSLQELFRAAAAGAAVEDASKNLRLWLKSPPLASIGTTVKFVARGYSTSTLATQTDLREILRTAIQSLRDEYARFAIGTAQAWLQAVDGSAVRAVLARAFTAAVILMSSFWEACPEGDRPALAVDVLSQLSQLQFCRVRTPSFIELLKETLLVAAASTEAGEGVLQSLPSYAEVTANVEVPDGQGGTCRWEADSILAAEMQFRMSLLGACVPRLPPEALSDRALPLVYLFLGHRLKPVVASAHMLFCNILQVVSEAESLAPYYVKRSLENFPRGTPLSAFTAGMDALARTLPPGSPAVLFCFRSIAGRATILMQIGTEAEAALGLVHLLAYLLLVMDIQVMEDGLSILKQLVLRCPRGAQRQAIDGIGRAVAASDDYTRKLTLVRWCQDLLHSADLPASLEPGL